jgi:hypothetical protein
MAFIGNTVQTQGFSPAIDYFNGNGVTVTFTLSRPVASVAQVIVAVDNVIQNPSSAFGVVGNSITFTSAPLSGTNNIWVEYTSLITTYQGISQDPTVIGDIRATGGYLAEGDFGNSFVDGNLIDYVTGAGRLTVGELDNLIFYHGGTSGRSEMMKLSYAGASTLEGGLTATGAGSFQGVKVGLGNNSIATNTAVGQGSALGSITSGARNVAFGSSAAAATTTGNGIVAVGYGALATNTTGSGNTAIGGNDVTNGAALQLNTTGSNNVAIGTASLFNNTTASYNTAVGYASLYQNTTGTNNTANGYYSLLSNTTGGQNTAHGWSALQANTTGSNNTAVGYTALYANTTAGNNTAVGREALRFNTTGTNNTAVGYNASYANTTGAFNVAMGSSDGFYGAALQTLSTGSYNIAIGNGALASATTPQGCVAMGFQAAPNLTTGHSGIYVGYGTRSSTAAAQWEIVVGGNIYGTVTGKGDSTGFIAPGGNGAVYQGNNSSTWSTTSDQRLKKNIVNNNTGLNIINKIQVRNFEYRLPEEIDAELKPTDAINRTGVQLGVIAQEIQKVSEEFVKTESTGVMSVDSDNLVWYLINAVKELNAKVTALEAQLESR